IKGIEVTVEAISTMLSTTLTTDLSWDNGTTWSATKATVTPAGTVEAVLTVGGGSGTWGRVWGSTEKREQNFKLRMQNTGAAAASIDQIQIKVYYSFVAVPRTVQVYNASTTWVCPTGVSRVTAETWGGGGGPRLTSSNSSGGGGAGAYSRSFVS